MSANLQDNDSAQSGVEESAERVPYASIGARKVLIQQYDYAVRTLMDMVVEGDLKLDPDYQRNYRWDDERASRFIESIVLNIPVPVIYLAEEGDGTFSVIDGQQRLTSLFRYFKPAELTAMFPDRDLTELVLTGLQVRPDLNSLRYTGLDPADRSVLAKRPIRCIAVLNESDATLKFEVFERLNSGSAALTHQETRNCIYRGSYNKLIKELAANAKFLEMVALPELARKSMTAEELVLRFLAYRELSDGITYSGNYTEYLNNHMEENRELSDARATDLKALFTNTVELIHSTLKPGVAFRKPGDRTATDQFTHVAINGAIYESQMIAVSKLVERGSAVPTDLRERILKAFADDDYWGSLFQGTTKKAKVLRRNGVLADLVLG